MTPVHGRPAAVRPAAARRVAGLRAAALALALAAVAAAPAGAGPDVAERPRVAAADRARADAVRRRDLDRLARGVAPRAHGDAAARAVAAERAAWLAELDAARARQRAAGSPAD